MSGGSRIERRLPTILADLGSGPYPDYADTLLARTASARQRPGWAFPERWFPMGTAYSATVATPRIPWRVVGAVAPFHPDRSGRIEYRFATDLAADIVAAVRASR